MSELNTPADRLRQELDERLALAVGKLEKATALLQKQRQMIEDGVRGMHEDIQAIAGRMETRLGLAEQAAQTYRDRRETLALIRDLVSDLRKQNPTPPLKIAWWKRWFHSKG